MKYIDADKLIAGIQNMISAIKKKNNPNFLGNLEQCLAAAEVETLSLVLETIQELQQEQPE